MLANVAAFDSAFRLYTTNGQVNEYNFDYMVQLGAPYIQVYATNNGPKAEKVSITDAGNLYNIIPFYVGAYVMFLENLWQEAGLVNGALGRVADITWLEGVNPRAEAPYVVFVEFDNYAGIFYFVGDRRRCRVVPIFRAVCEFLVGTAACIRIQFPLTVAFAVTVYKCQGITASWIVADISGRDFQAGLTYVAVSRAISLQSVIFDVPFDFEAIRQTSRESYAAREEDTRRRAGQTLQPNRDDSY